MEEIADTWIVTIAENSLAFEMMLVMAQFSLNVAELRIELVFLCFLRITKLFVSCFWHYKGLSSMCSVEALRSP